MTRDHSTIAQTWARRKRRLLLALLAGACILALPSSAIAATNVTRDVQQYTVSPDSMCGFTGTSFWVWNLAIGPTAHGITFEAGGVAQTFVADNGRGVKITYGDGVVKIDPTVYYPDGSSSITVVSDGLNVKAQALGGPLLQQSTGRLTYTYHFDASGDFVSLTIDSATGPENNVTGAPDCSVIGPYLAGG
jgi:hypothetical protein